MEFVKFVAGFLLGMISGSLFMSIPTFLLLRKPFLKKLEVLGFLLNHLPITMTNRIAIFYLIAVCFLTALVAYVEFFRWIPYVIGMIFVCIPSVGTLLTGMSSPNLRAALAKDYSWALLPGWEFVPASDSKHCRNPKCHRQIPDSERGFMEDSFSRSENHPFPKPGEFGFCSADCFNEVADGQKAESSM